MKVKIAYYLDKRYVSDGREGDRIPSAGSTVILDGRRYSVEQIIYIFEDSAEESCVLANMFLTECKDRADAENTVPYADHITFVCGDRRVKEQFPKELKQAPIPEFGQYVIFEDDYSDTMFLYCVTSAGQDADGSVHVSLELAEDGGDGYMDAVIYRLEELERKEMLDEF